MRRIIDPLTRMGARIESTGGRPPLVIEGAHLHAIEHAPDVPSAQVKSGVLLAGLQATGLTSVVEPAPTRDHTERALETFGVRVERAGLRVSVMGGQRLQGRTLAVPGDVSSATFWAALAAGTPGGRIEITGVGLNPSRTGMLPILERAGAHVESSLSAEGGGEPAGRLTIGFNECRDFAIEPHEVPGVIDEIPALAALAVMMPPGRRFRVSGASELRVKESDRISALARGFRSIGAAIEEQEDGFTIESRPLAGGIADAEGDHRLAMCFAIAATRAGSPTLITGASSVDVSYPGFFGELARLTGGR
jgi:3-phosphoshikimate 1-carboxyvinyltransferase